MTERIKKTFYVTALVPAISKQANDFLSSLDLGIDGAYIQDVQTFMITATNEGDFEIAKQKIISKLEIEGCKNINVWYEKG